MRPTIVAGNWKMHGSRSFGKTLVDGLTKAMSESVFGDNLQVLVLPPMPYLSELIHVFEGSPVQFGAQDVSMHEEGAFTGEVSASMLKDIGCTHVLVGHSERRQYHREDGQIIADKLRAVRAAGMVPILCVGETMAQREAEQTQWALQKQLEAWLTPDTIGELDGAWLAYEPVWAIGTGHTASAEQVQAVHAFLRGEVAAIDGRIADSLPILYGGSVKPHNAADLFALDDVDGALVGGASLALADFTAIIESSLTDSKP